MPYTPTSGYQLSDELRNELQTSLNETSQSINQWLSDLAVIWGKATPGNCKSQASTDTGVASTTVTDPAGFKHSSWRPLPSRDTADRHAQESNWNSYVDSVISTFRPADPSCLYLTQPTVEAWDPLALRTADRAPLPHLVFHDIMDDADEDLSLEADGYLDSKRLETLAELRETADFDDIHAPDEHIILCYTFIDNLELSTLTTARAHPDDPTPTLLLKPDFYTHRIGLEQHVPASAEYEAPTADDAATYLDGQTDQVRCWLDNLGHNWLNSTDDTCERAPVQYIQKVDGTVARNTDDSLAVLTDPSGVIHPYWKPLPDVHAATTTEQKHNWGEYVRSTINYIRHQTENPSIPTPPQKGSALKNSIPLIPEGSRDRYAAPVADEHAATPHNIYNAIVIAPPPTNATLTDQNIYIEATITANDGTNRATVAHQTHNIVATQQHFPQHLLYRNQEQTKPAADTGLTL